MTKWLRSRTLQRLVVVAVLAAGFMGAHLATAPAAHAAQASGKGQANHCYATKVELRGSQQPVVTCLDATTGGLPYISTGCGSSSVTLYVDAWQQGSSICFYGVGTANLTNYYWWISVPGGWVRNTWNDAATSWLSHTTQGWFYTDINRGGTWAYFDPNSTGNFSGNPIPNDSLSSVEIIAS